jgi:hypothetical protein
MAKTDRHNQPQGGKTPPEDPTGFSNPKVQERIPADIPRQTPEGAAAQDEGADSQEMLNAFALMKTPKLMVIGGHVGLTLLTNYRPGFGFSAEHHRNFSMNTGERPPVITAVPYCVPWGDKQAGDRQYELQFIEVDDPNGPSIIRNLQRHAQARPAETTTDETSSQ